jgi:hypothetical protein
MQTKKTNMLKQLKISFFLEMCLRYPFASIRNASWLEYCIVLNPNVRGPENSIKSLLNFASIFGSGIVSAPKGSKL